MNKKEVNEIVSVLVGEIFYNLNLLTCMCGCEFEECERLKRECIKRITPFVNQDTNDLILKYVD